MQIKHFIIILFIIIAFDGYAQTELIISGQIFSHNNTEPLAYAQIVLNHKNGIIANKQGQFQIKVELGDTLSASYIGYETSNYIVPNSLQKNEYIIGFFLRIDTVQLCEVVIYPKYTAAELKRQMSTAIPLSVEEKNARQNIDIASNTALVDNHLYKDSEQYQDVQIGHQQVRTEYKAMINPNQMVGFNFITIASLTYQLIKGSLTQQEDSKAYITPNDSRKLREIFENKKSGD